MTKCFSHFKNNKKQNSMKYPSGLVILIFSIYAITDLAIKTRYTRKRLLDQKKYTKNKLRS